MRQSVWRTPIIPSMNIGLAHGNCDVTTRLTSTEPDEMQQDSAILQLSNSCSVSLPFITTR